MIFFSNHKHNAARPISEMENVWVMSNNYMTIFEPAPLDKMAVILADDIFQSTFLNENDSSSD